MMIKILLKLHWIREGKDEDPFWKFVDMPSVPPEGCRVFLDDNGVGHLGVFEVEFVWWSETEPNYFEIDLEAMDTGDEERSETIDWMRQLGWTHESDKIPKLTN